MAVTVAINVQVTGSEALQHLNAQAQQLLGGDQAKMQETERVVRSSTDRITVNIDRMTGSVGKMQSTLGSPPTSTRAG